MPSYRELQAQIAELTAQAKVARDAEVGQVIAHIRAQMQDYGITIYDLARRAPTFEVSLPPKYRDPQTGATWTGRGKAPRWLAAQIQAGHRKDDFLVAACTGQKKDPETGSDLTQKTI